jgi:heptose III glucuronosyltransferase
MKNSNIPALSIIVPIYNVEKYLSECLESILCQNFDFSFEIILVNDGATDGSKKIAKSYSNNYPDKFIYLEQVNKGLSAARNSGLNISKGQYVLFLDSDDCLSNTGLSDLVHKAMNQNLDIMVGNFINFYEDSSEFKNKKIVQSDTEIGEAWLTKSLSQRKFMPAVWFKLYRRSFLLDQNIMFVDGLINEDQLYSILTFVKAMNVSSIDIPFYRYRHRSGSISKVLDMKSAIRRVESDLYSFF